MLSGFSKKVCASPMSANSAYYSLTLLSQRTNDPLPNVVVYFEMESNHKNNFSYGPIETDNNGRLTVTLERIKEEISTASSMFPMDYGGLCSLSGRVRIVIYSRRSLKRMRRLQALWQSDTHQLSRIVLENAPPSDLIGDWLDWKSFLSDQDSISDETVVIPDSPRER